MFRRKKCRLSCRRILPQILHQSCHPTSQPKTVTGGMETTPMDAILTILAEAVSAAMPKSQRRMTPLPLLKNCLPSSRATMTGDTATIPTAVMRTTPGEGESVKLHRLRSQHYLRKSLLPRCPKIRQAMVNRACRSSLQASRPLQK